MIPIPTLRLRFVERDLIVSQDQFSANVKTIRVLQQFWEVDNGKDVVGDMFKTLVGEWRDIPLEEEK